MLRVINLKFDIGQFILYLTWEKERKTIVCRSSGIEREKKTIHGTARDKKHRWRDGDKIG